MWVEKNIGYLYAMELCAQFIYDTDDIESINDPVLPSAVESIQVLGHVWNPYPQLGFGSNSWPQGFPIEQIHAENTKSIRRISEKHCCKNLIGIVQFVAASNTDVDVPLRFPQRVGNQTTKYIAIPSHAMSPYNAKSTLHHYDVFWGLMLPIAVPEQAFDILRGYLTQRFLWDIKRELVFSLDMYGLFFPKTVIIYSSYIYLHPKHSNS